MKSLRVAHITDIHLLAESGAKFYGVDTAISLQNVLDAILELEVLPNIIIVTGDLAEDGLTATYQRFCQILAGIDIPIYVLPGNHDNIGNMHDIITGESIHFLDKVKVESWVFIFVNSQVSGESYGYISSHEMALLKANLETAGSAPVVVALHHTPMEICPRVNCQLRNVNNFNQLIDSFSCVKAVIAGHTHTDAEKNNIGHTQFTTPSTFAQVAHGLTVSSDENDFWAFHTMDSSSQGFRVLDLRSDGQITSRVHWLLDS